MKKTNKIFLALFVFLFVALSLPMSTNKANAFFVTPTCNPGDGCVPNCPGSGDLDCNPATCSIKGSGGLIPCGKSCDDPNTPLWNETNSCTLCSSVLMGQLIIEFLLKIVAVLAVIFIAFGGILYIFAAGSEGTIEKAKSIIKYVLIGFIVIFIAWAMVDTILAMFGYIDPIGGEWYSINC